MTWIVARLTGIVLVAAWLTGISSAARAGDAPVLDGAQLFATKPCFACHGQDPETPLLPEYPRLAGQNEAHLPRHVKDIKAQRRTKGNAPATAAILFMVDEAEMKVLAEYLCPGPIPADSAAGG